MLPIRRPRLAGCLAAMLFVSCTTPTGMCGCSMPPPSAVMYGRVTDPAGAPVQGAGVLAEAGGPGCVEPLEALGEVQTAADGRYRIRLAVFTRDPRPGDCLRAFAMPPAGSALRGSDSVAFAVRLGNGNPLDSVRVDLVLRAP